MSGVKSRPQTVKEAERHQRDLRNLKNRLQNLQERREVELDPEKRRALDVEIQATELDIAGEDNIQEDFAAWLVGKGKTEDHARTPWERTPLNHNPEVVQYLQQFHDARWKFIFQLNEVLFAVRRGDANIGQLFNYYRFFIRGKLDADDINSIDFLKFYRELGPGNAPYYEDDFIEPNSVALIDNWWLHWQKVPLGVAESYARDRTSIRSQLVQTERLLKSVDRGLTHYDSVDDVRRDERELREKLEETTKRYFYNLGKEIEKADLPPELALRVRADATRQFVRLRETKIAAVKEFADMRVQQADIANTRTRLQQMLANMPDPQTMGRPQKMAHKAMKNQGLLLDAQQKVLDSKLRRLKEKWQDTVPELAELDLEFMHPIGDEDRKRFARLADQIDTASEFSKNPLKFDKLPEVLLPEKQQRKLKRARKNVDNWKALVDADPSNQNKIDLLSEELELNRREQALLFTEDDTNDAKRDEMKRRIQSLQPMVVEEDMQGMHDVVLKDTVRAFYDDLVENPSQFEDFFDNVRPYLMEQAARSFNKAGDFPSGGESVDRRQIEEMLHEIRDAGNWGQTVEAVRKFEDAMLSEAAELADLAQEKRDSARTATSEFETENLMQQYQGYLKERERIMNLSSNVQVHISNVKSKMMAAARDRIEQLKREATVIFDNDSLTVRERIWQITAHKNEAVRIWQVMKTERDFEMPPAPPAEAEEQGPPPEVQQKQQDLRQQMSLQGTHPSASALPGGLGTGQSFLVRSPGGSPEPKKKKQPKPIIENLPPDIMPVEKNPDEN